MDYETFLRNIVQEIPKHASSMDIEKIVIQKIPSNVDEQFIIFKNLKRRKMELCTNEESIDNIFYKIVLCGVTADVLTKMGRNSYYVHDLQ